MHAPIAPDPPSKAALLLSFNQQLLEQSLTLVAAHQADGRLHYGDFIGAHLRHLIEHYEALLIGARGGGVDYDQRARERELETNTGLARSRLLSLQAQLACWHPATLDRPVRVAGKGGMAGEFAFSVSSSIGRELAYLASHAVHHFALLKAHCQQHGIAVDADFGKAPGTVAHERASRAVAHAHTHEEPLCSAAISAI